jgi:hypothetical protein
MAIPTNRQGPQTQPKPVQGPQKMPPPQGPQRQPEPEK